MITKKKLEKKIEKLKALKRKNPSKFHRMYSKAMKSAIKSGNSYGMFYIRGNQEEIGIDLSIK